MKTLPQSFPRSSKAFAIFLDELRAQVAKTEEFLSAPPADQELVLRLKEGFHRAKGGAGFFGLDAVGRVSTRLEDMFLQPLSELVERSDEVSALLNELKASLHAVKD